VEELEGGGDSVRQRRLRGDAGGLAGYTAFCGHPRQGQR